MFGKSRLLLYLLIASHLSLAWAHLPSDRSAGYLVSALLLTLSLAIWLVRYRNTPTRWSMEAMLLIGIDLLLLGCAITTRDSRFAALAFFSALGVLLSTYSTPFGGRSLIHLLVLPAVLFSPAIVEPVQRLVSCDELIARVCNTAVASTNAGVVRDGAEIRFHENSVSAADFRHQLFGVPMLWAGAAIWHAFQWRTLPQFVMLLPTVMFAGIFATTCSVLISSIAFTTQVSEPWPDGFTAFVAFIPGLIVILSGDALILFLTSPIPIEVPDAETANTDEARIWINPLVVIWNKCVAAASPAEIDHSTDRIPKWTQLLIGLNCIAACYSQLFV